MKSTVKVLGAIFCFLLNSLAWSKTVIQTYDYSESIDRGDIVEYLDPVTRLTVDGQTYVIPELEGFCESMGGGAHVWALDDLSENFTRELGSWSYSWDYETRSYQVSSTQCLTERCPIQKVEFKSRQFCFKKDIYELKFNPIVYERIWDRENNIVTLVAPKAEVAGRRFGFPASQYGRLALFLCQAFGYYGKDPKQDFGFGDLAYRLKTVKMVDDIADWTERGNNREEAVDGSEPEWSDVEKGPTVSLGSVTMSESPNTINNLTYDHGGMVAEFRCLINEPGADEFWRLMGDYYKR